MSIEWFLGNRFRGGQVLTSDDSVLIRVDSLPHKPRIEKMSVFQPFSECFNVTWVIMNLGTSALYCIYSLLTKGRI